MVEELKTSDGVSKEYLAILAQIEEFCNHSSILDIERTGFIKGKIHFVRFISSAMILCNISK